MIGLFYFIATGEIIPIGAFANFPQLHKVILPDSITHIAFRAFINSPVADINFPKGLQFIDDYAFWGTKLREVSLPETVKHIGIGAFSFTPLCRVSLSEGIICLSDYAFSDTSIREIVIPNSVKHLGNSVFSNCTLLEKVTLGKGITSISKSLFFRCLSLNEVLSEGKIKTILENAFAGSGIKQFIAPDSVKEIKNRAFADSALHELSVSDTTNVSLYSIIRCDNLCNIVIRDKKSKKAAW